MDSTQNVATNVMKSFSDLKKPMAVVLIVSVMLILIILGFLVYFY
jgi:hypothetical protein